MRVINDKAYSFFDDKSVLITGGTGSFGNLFIKNVLERSKPRRVIVYSRDEFKQYEMQQRFDLHNYPRSATSSATCATPIASRWRCARSTASCTRPR